MDAAKLTRIKELRKQILREKPKYDEISFLISDLESDIEVLGAQIKGYEIKKSRR